MLVFCCFLLSTAPCHWLIYLNWLLHIFTKNVYMLFVYSYLLATLAYEYKSAGIFIGLQVYISGIFMTVGTTVSGI